MKFYFPDSQDMISPTYDFRHDEYSPLRVRQRDDLYAHEVLAEPPYQGLLVSKSIIDGSINGAGKYSEAQRGRLYRLGVRRYFRLPDTIETLGDNGAFNYVQERVPPVTSSEALDFYEQCGFDAGVSVDHVILGYNAASGLEGPDPDWAERRLLTLRLAEEFITLTIEQASSVNPVGAAQGWSPASYADSVRHLQMMGYRRIALGGMVPLKTDQILACLRAIEPIRAPTTELHLLGVTRVDSVNTFADFGVSSFDSTSAFRQSFMDDRRNYHALGDDYIAIRVPQVEGNPVLKRNILAGLVSQKDAVAAERACLRELRAYDAGTASVACVLDALANYEVVAGSKKSYIQGYERTLRNAPWRNCECRICNRDGIQVAIFRGAERNKRRGFHNLHILAKRLNQRSLATADERVSYG